MQFRLPWIQSRKRLLIAALIDGIIFVSLYYALFQAQFDRFPGFSLRLAVLLSLWMLSSYIFGRFTSGSVKFRLGLRRSLFNQLTSTGLAITVTLVIITLDLWLFARQPIETTYRSFLVPFLFFLALLSFLFQFSIDRILSNKQPAKNQTWYFLGSSSIFEKLCESLAWSRLPVTLVRIYPEQLKHSDVCQIVVDEINDQSHEVLEDLLRLKQNGASIINHLEWCEEVLQRFPSILLDVPDILTGDFSISYGTLQSRIKRIGDIAVASILLLATSPLLLISGILIKLGDGGPIFYSQIRTGYANQLFTIRKLRTMRIDAEIHGAQWSRRSDTRITNIGKLLRRIRIDELPQLVSVINGTMSLIGPRPERPEFDQELEHLIPFYRLRYSIKPGLSGWAQVNYPYGSSIQDSANKLSYDLYYLRHCSFWLDLLILIKTFKLVTNADASLSASE